MRLPDIIKGSGVLELRGEGSPQITGITCDSRKVQPGWMFIAVRGFSSDGHDYIGAAVKAGAAAIVCETIPETIAQAPNVGKSMDAREFSEEERPETIAQAPNVGKIAGAKPATEATETTTGTTKMTGATAGTTKMTGATTEVTVGASKEAVAAAVTPVMVRVKSSRYATAIIAANFYDNPSRKLNLVGITGTNGKTTTVTLLYRLFTSLGYSCGLLSTIANYVGDKRFEAVNTTSDSITINSLLADMADAGCEYCFMEVSSIGIEQDRVAGLDFKVGIFSNLTHDHLDYHKTFAEYLRCKKLFFDMLPPHSFAITNVDDRNGEVMVQNTRAKVVTYSCRAAADHTARIMEESFDGMQLRIDGKEVWTKLIGKHNVYNILCVYAAAICLGASQEEVLVAISTLEAARGRLETIRAGRDINVVIDYAHTPDALSNVLETLRDVCGSRTLICLFGCGGDRDRSKRPEMGKIAGELADRVIVTSDNSRTERTLDIMEDIRAGMSPEDLSKALFIEDREQAIRTAILTASDGATILLAGKGHETYQIIGTEKRHFDEREIVSKILAETGMTRNTKPTAKL